MTYPTTSEGGQSLGLNNVDAQRVILALQDRLRANDKALTSVAVQTGAGTTGTTTGSAASSDFRGQITVTPGGTGIAAGAQAIITPSSVPAGWSTTGSGVILVPLLAACLVDAVGAYVTLQATTWTLNFAAAPTTAHVYTYAYILVA